MGFGAVSDIGKHRKINEDNFFAYRNERVTGGMVADGMGGHNSGELASKMMCTIVKQFIISEYDPDMDYMEMAELIRTAFAEANLEIYRASKKSGNEGMGTTATLAFIYDGKLITAHVGDSRCYKITDNSITQLTADHSYVNELVRNGQITEEDARSHPNKNLITRAIGTEISVKVDMDIKTYMGETILLCSDGLTNMISDEQILDTVKENEELEDAVKKMVELANKKGGSDNITVLAFNN